jgi:hypothetical protein
MDLLNPFLNSLSTSQLVQLAQSAIITSFVGFVSIVAFLIYMRWEDHKEAQEANEQMIVYGTRETAVTIQHQTLNKDDEEFLRHVRALSRSDLTYNEIMEILGNFIEFLKIHNHTNCEDLMFARRGLQRNLRSAWAWLAVAQAFWILYPWDEMIPFIAYEFVENTPQPTPQPTPHPTPQPTPQPSPALRPAAEPAAESPASLTPTES